MSSTLHQPSTAPASAAVWEHQYLPAPLHGPPPPGRVIFTRQLWQKNMPEGTDSTVSNRSQDNPNNSHRRTSSPSPSRVGSKTPLTPEESPPFSRTTSTRKRTAGAIEDDEAETSSGVHTRQSSGDSAIHVCICQPDPKIPRPRNAFILYRQHHQASIVAQNPGLANPEISKIIGEQWQNQVPEVKNKWKALAEEEKIRHQQQYPTYRYQPKRTGRRNSINSEAGEKPRCQKCGGRSILAPSTGYSNLNSPALPQTPGSAVTPVTRTLPVLRDLSLQSPAARRMAKQFPSVSQAHHLDEREELGPLSPDLKRRRFNGDHLPPQLTRVVAPRYGSAPGGTTVQPGTPFPFPQPAQHPYPPAAGIARRESLPGLRGMVSPQGPMPPPPRPGPGYQQHRLSQGHIPHDRSLTLPPLQTSTPGGVSGVVATAGIGKTAKEQIMGMDFRGKVHVLRRVAPPVPVRKNALRGPLVVIEGDSSEAVLELGSWLASTLCKGDDLNVSLLEGPKLSPIGGKDSLMSQYHRLVADWIEKGSQIRESLAIKIASPTDSVMIDAAPAKKLRKDIDENYNDSDDSSVVKAGEDTRPTSDGRSQRSNSDAEKMDIDTASKTASGSAKPVSIIPNYSLHACNFFACNISIHAHDPYSPSDHWQWTASQWRGIISPDLTIYVADAATGDGGKQSVDILDEGNLFVVKRTKVNGKEALEIEPSTLRRLGFEVSEWVRAFGANAE